MSTTIFTSPGETPASFNRWDIPVKMGLMIGMLSVILSTVNYMFIMPSSYVAFLVSNGVIFVLSIFLCGVAGARQRKAMGGYITLKEAFAAIFIALLISTIITTIWGIVYAKYVDPQVLEKLKEGTLAFMERMKAPQEKLDETAAKFDKQMTDGINPGELVKGFAQSLVLASIFGFIAAAIVKRAPKQQMI